MAITFNEVLKKNYILDGSGVDNPHDWLWDNYSNNPNIYYPVKRIFKEKIKTVNELINELMIIKNKDLPIFIFSELDMFEITDVDTNLTDRVDLNVRRQK